MREKSKEQKPEAAGLVACTSREQGLERWLSGSEHTLLLKKTALQVTHSHL